MLQITYVATQAAIRTITTTGSTPVPTPLRITSRILIFKKGQIVYNNWYFALYESILSMWFDTSGHSMMQVDETMKGLNITEFIASNRNVQNLWKPYLIK